jgi:large subunit ribosomal protein L23
MPAIDINSVVKRPLITEKSTWEGTDRNRYAFVVDIHSTKDQIKRAIQDLYNVRVLSVATQIRKGEEFRTRAGVSNTGNWKKAIVALHPEDKIDLF